MGSDDSALQAVVAADVELMQLRAEEAEITGRHEAAENGVMENGRPPAEESQEDDDADRLNEIYERMQVRLQGIEQSSCDAMESLEPLLSVQLSPNCHISSPVHGAQELQQAYRYSQLQRRSSVMKSVRHGFKHI